MKNRPFGWFTGLLLALCYGPVAAQPPAGTPALPTTQALDARQQALVGIAAFTARGELPMLRQALSNGLNAGLSINEIKEILVQLYAYAGFPRSLNALSTFMGVLQERKQNGIDDRPGPLPHPLPAGKSSIQLGTEIQTRLVGQPVSGPVYAFAPVIDQFLKEHLFGDIFGRDNLDFKTREIATIAALAALGGAENQLRSHLGVGRYNGLTEAQLQHLVAIIETDVSPPEGRLARQLLQPDAGLQPPVAGPPTLFPKGEKITNNNFTGTAWLEQMTQPDSLNTMQAGNVTFEPAARTHWHSHPGGQILLITDGTGYYQEEGSPRKIIRKGDYVKCPAHVPHWHGASPGRSMTQVAVTDTRKGPTVWLRPVSEQEYNKE